MRWVWGDTLWRQKHVWVFWAGFSTNYLELIFKCLKMTHKRAVTHFKGGTTGKFAALAGAQLEPSCFHSLAKQSQTADIIRRVKPWMVFVWWPFCESCGWYECFSFQFKVVFSPSFPEVYLLHPFNHAFKCASDVTCMNLRQPDNPQCISPQPAGAAAKCVLQSTDANVCLFQLRNSLCLPKLRIKNQC